jgi:hypothetical protein
MPDTTSNIHNSAGISESVSEIQPGRKRGRPPVFREDEDDFIRSFFPGITTKRGRMNRNYSIRALQILDYAKPYQWLTSTPDHVNAGTGKVRFTLLAELGRISDEKLLREAAREICRLKPATAQGVSMIRALRGRQMPGGTIGLTRAIVATVDRYLEAHRNTTMHMVFAALENARDAFAAASQKTAGDRGKEKK